MTTEQRWSYLKMAARQSFDFEDKPGHLESFIQYHCEPSFEPIFSLQFIWTDKILKWRKIVWDYQNDRNKFFETDGFAKVVLSQPEPDITITTGEASAEILSDLIQHIQLLRISPRMESLRMFTLDGSTHKLTVGVSDVSTTFAWHTLPDEWEELGKIVEEILRIELTT